MNNLEGRINKIEGRLSRIEKLLTNHVEHQKAMIDNWVKIIIPTIGVLAPVLIALIQSWFK